MSKALKRSHDFSMFAYNPENNDDKEGQKISKSTPSRSPKSTSTKKTSTASPRKKKEKATNVTARSPSTPDRTTKQDDKILKTPSPKKKDPTKLKSPPSSRKRQRIEPGSIDPPEHWEAIYTLVEELRADRTAPMDYDGGQALPERHRGDKVYRYQVLTALMLSSQTKDAVVGDAMRSLQKYGLDVESIRDIEVSTLSTLIGKVGFYNNKTKFMKETADILLREYDGDIPSTAEDMMKLPGVGPKMVRKLLAYFVVLNMYTVLTYHSS
jgi:endonuclease III